MFRLRYLITIVITLLAFQAIIFEKIDAASSVEIIVPRITSFNDSGWTILYEENFDSDYVAVDGQTFGTDDWLVYQLLNDGAITVANGYAQLNAPDFWNAALIRSVDIMPEEYKVRTKIGYINYDLTNYEQEDYDDPDFNNHQGHYENGMYFLTVTDRVCVGDECAENWWHYHRKMVIDVDNHINWDDPGETFHPVYMVYMAPEENSGGNLLRTWDGEQWDTSPWNWNTAYTYEYDTWYYAELEILDDSLTLRLYDGDQNILEETTPVDLSLVNAMDDTLEYLYLGEPHTDDYEGDVRIDEITLLIPGTGQAIDDDASMPKRYTISQNYPNPFNASTIIKYELPQQSRVTIDIYDILGKLVTRLVDDDLDAGYHQAIWRAEDVNSGVYFYKIQAGDNIDTGRMMLVK